MSIAESHLPAGPVVVPAPLIDIIPRPVIASTTVTWHGANFTLDVAACRQGIVEWLLMEGKQLHELADAAGVSRMSLWRFMQGRQCSPATVRRILATAGVDIKRVCRAAMPAALNIWALSLPVRVASSLWTSFAMNQDEFWESHYILSIGGAHPLSWLLHRLFEALLPFSH